VIRPPGPTPGTNREQAPVGKPAGAVVCVARMTGRAAKFEKISNKIRDSSHAAHVPDMNSI
jgi:hypothetical protein